jgi:uncharacterized membrane protein YbhN (UPF0104 family)
LTPALTEPGVRRRWLRPALGAVLVAAAIWAIARNRAEVVAALADLAPWSVVAAFPAGLAAMAAALFVWRALMADFGYRLPLPAAARIFYVSQLGKYVPGSVWSILTQIELSRDYQIPKRTNVSVGVVAIALSVASGLCVAALLLPFAGGAAARHYWWILLIVPVLLAALHPRILGAGLNRALRLARRDPLPHTPSARGLAGAGAIQAVVWLCLGLQAWILLVGLGAPVWRSLPVAIGGYALAYGLGQMAIGLPAGAGVREAALTLALSAVVSAPTALVVALIARVVLTVIDLATAGAALALTRRRSR